MGLNEMNDGSVGDDSSREHGALVEELCRCYVEKCGSLWKADVVLKWLHSASLRLNELYKDTDHAGRQRRGRTETGIGIVPVRRIVLVCWYSFLTACKCVYLSCVVLVVVLLVQ